MSHQKFVLNIQSKMDPGSWRNIKGPKIKITNDLFLGVDAEVGVVRSGSGGELPGSCVELSDEAVVAALVVVEHLEPDVPVKIAVAEGANGQHELHPNLEMNLYFRVKFGEGSGDVVESKKGPYPIFC